MNGSRRRGAVSMAWFAGVAALSFGCGDAGSQAKPEGSSAPAKSAAAATSSKPGAALQPSAARPAPKDEAKPAAAPADAAAAPAPTAVTTPEQQSYPMGSIKPIPDACSNAHAIVANAPASLGEDYGWPYATQAMLANQQFKTVASASAPGQVSFAVHESNGALALVATCGDGSTCNHLAAMFKAVVKSSNPQLVCGDVTGTLGPAQKQVSLLSGDPASNVPEAGDTIGMCARIGACTIATKPDTTEDVAISCQKAPTKFKTACASKYPCAEVMACLGE